MDARILVGLQNRLLDVLLARGPVATLLSSNLTQLVLDPDGLARLRSPRRVRTTRRVRVGEDPDELRLGLRRRGRADDGLPEGGGDGLSGDGSADWGAVHGGRRCCWLSNP